MEFAKVSDDDYAKNFHRLHITLIKNGDHPILKKGIPKREGAYNPITGNVHEGLNGVYLDLVSEYKGFNEPRWVSLSDIEKKGYKIKSGEKGVGIAYRNRYNHITEGKVNGPRYQIVYNADQVLNFPKRDLTPQQIEARKEYRQKQFDNLSENTNGNPKNTFKKLAQMVAESQAKDKELAISIAIYRFCQDARIQYDPWAAKDLTNEVKLKASASNEKNTIDSIYHGNVQQKRILSKDMTFDQGDKFRDLRIQEAIKENIKVRSNERSTDKVKELTR